ncbi:MAG TPA: hypothetical protein DCR69_10495 [Clostridium sp.]|nr:hypothetical protein [Clostridium sp.]
MDNKPDLDKLMYLLGQENAVEELKNTMEPHEFSQKYKNQKVNIIENQDFIQRDNNIDSIQSTNKKGKKIMKKKIIVLIAAITATLAISATAYGAVKHYLVTTSKNEETGTLTCDIQTEAAPTKVPAMKVVPGYIPEGYIETANALGKYHPNGDHGVGGISICPPVYTTHFEQIYVSDVEETTLGGVKAQILTREGLEYNHIINMFYEKDGYVVTIYGADNTSLEELKKVAENIKCEEIPGEFVELEANDIVDNKDNYIETIETKNPKITDNNIFNIGEEKNDLIDSASGLNYTVNSIEVMDKLPALDKSKFSDYNEYLEFINEDGTLKDYERINAEWWENNKMNRETEMVGMKFIYVTLTMTNPSEKDIKEIYFAPRIIFLKKNANDTLEENMEYGGSKNALQIENCPFYFDKSGYERKGFRFCDFDGKETKEIHLAYAVDEDHIDDAYISFNTHRFTIIDARKPGESYIKVTK